MANFRAWAEKSPRTGNYVVRYRDGKTKLPSGRWKVFTHRTIDKIERLKVNDEWKTAKWIADEMVQKLCQKQLSNELGFCDLSLELEPLIESWIEEGRMNNLSWESIKNRERSIKSYVEEMQIRILNDITPESLQDWKECMVKGVSQKLMASTIRHRLLLVKTFIRWLIDNKKIIGFIFPQKLLPKNKDPMPKFYLTDEFLRLDQAMARISAEGRLAIHLAHSGGLRLIELVGDGRERKGILWEDLQWNKDGSVDLLIRKEVTKGQRRSRMIRLAKNTTALLGSRKTGPIINLARWKLWNFFSQARKLAGINPKLTIHGLRHSFAKNYLQRSRGNLEGARQLLGHEDISTTQIYSQFEKSYLFDGIEEAELVRLREEALLNQDEISIALAGQNAGQNYDMTKKSVKPEGTAIDYHRHNKHRDLSGKNDQKLASH